MPSRYSSDDSRTDAQALAENLGIDYRTIAIEPAHAAFLEMLAPSFGDLRSRSHRGEPAEPDPRRRPDGAVEQVRLARAHDWQQERDGRRLHDALWRHGRRVRRHQGRAQDDRVPAVRAPQHESGSLIPERRARPSPRRPSCVPTSATTRASRRTRCSTRCSPRTSKSDLTAAELIAAGFDEAIVRRITRLVDLAEYKRRQSPPGVRVTPKAFGKDRRLPITNAYRG